MKMRRFAFILAVVFLVASLMPMTAMAKTNTKAKTLAPFRDVTPRRVDAKSYKAIVFVKKYGGWKGLTIGGKLYPNRPMKKGEFIRLLRNLYGEEMEAIPDDKNNKNAEITSNYVCERFARLSEDLGYPIQWKGYKTIMRRKDVARYVVIFANFGPALMPGPY